MEKSKERLEILSKIEMLEKTKQWDISPENDPETIELKPNKVDYLNKKISSKIASYFANIMGARYFDKMLKNNKNHTEILNSTFEKVNISALDKVV